MRPDWGGGGGAFGGWVVLNSFWFECEHLLKLAGLCRSVLRARPDGQTPLPGWMVLAAWLPRYLVTVC